MTARKRQFEYQRFNCKDRYGNEINLSASNHTDAYYRAVESGVLADSTITVKDKEGNTMFFGNDWNDGDCNEFSIEDY